MPSMTRRVPIGNISGLIDSDRRRSSPTRNSCTASGEGLKLIVLNVGSVDSYLHRRGMAKLRADPCLQDELSGFGLKIQLWVQLLNDPLKNGQ